MKKKTKTNIKIKCLCLAVILILVAGCATRGGSERVGQAVITGIDITDNKLNIVADKPLTSSIRVSPDDLHKVIVEVPDARLGITSVKIKSNSTGIVEIVSSLVEEPLLARFEILLRAPVTSLPVSMESASSVDNKDTSLSIKVKEKPKVNGVEIVFEESPAPQEKIQKAELFEARKEEKEVESGDTNKKSVPLRIIIVSGEKDASEILSELKKGKSFAFLAKEKSIDESRGGYGYIGNVAISKLKAPLREAVTRLKDGETSGAIKLEDDRYAIVQVIDQSYYRKGSAALKSKDYETAERDLLKHVELNPDTVKAHIMLGQIYEERKEFEKAERMYKDAISFNPNNPKNEEAYECLGRLYLNQKQYDKANEIYEEGLKYLPGSESIEGGIRNIKGIKKLTSKMDNSQKPVVEVKEKVVPTPQEIPPVKPKVVVIPKEKPVDKPKEASMAQRVTIDNGNTLSSLKAPGETVHLRIIVVSGEKDAGEILSEIKNGKPFAFLAKEISLDEKSRDEYGYLGKVAVNKLEAPLREAASRLKDGEISGAIKLTDNRYAIIQIVELRYYTKGAKAFREKDFKTAEINLLKHIELNPDAAKARVMLGEIYENREETEKAIEMYKEAVSFDPKYEKAYKQLGKAYLYLGQYEKAKEIYEEGLKHIPDAWSLWKGLKTAKMKMSQE